MAKLIQNPTGAEILQYVHGIQGRIRLGLEEFVIPTHQIADSSRASIPVPVRSAVANFGLAANVAEQPTLRFEAIPGTVCIIRRITMRIDNGDADFHAFFAGNAASIAALGNTAVKSFTDGRYLAGSQLGAQLPSGVLTFGTQVAGLGTVHFQSRLTVDVANIITPTGLWAVGAGNAGLFGFVELQVAALNRLYSGSIEWDEYAIP